MTKNLFADFKPREYQKPFFDALFNKGYKKLLVINPRRSGKDLSAWLAVIEIAIDRTCLVYYCLPTLGQARKVIWDGQDFQGNKFTDYVPESYVSKKNESEMKIVLKNNSIIQLIGAESYSTALVGTNPFVIVFSEYSRFTSSKPYEFARPILAANQGYCLFLTTPFGKNHAYYLWQEASKWPDWFVSYKKTSEIKHLSEDILEIERREMSRELYAQEYECSWEQGVEGSYYGVHLEALRQAGQITHVPYQSNMLVNTAWDIGVNDDTTIIFWQANREHTSVNIIDCYSNNNVGVEHYIDVLEKKGWRYGNHWAPHDLEVRDWADRALTRRLKAKHLGLDFKVLPQTLIQDGIENCWTHFNKFWIDEVKCKPLIDALENYRREYDELRQMHIAKPLKSRFNHYADAFRYLCQSLGKNRVGLTAEEFNRQKAEALYGHNPVPRNFQIDPRFNIR